MEQRTSTLVYQRSYRRSDKGITTVARQSMLKSRWKGANNVQRTNASPMQRSRLNYLTCQNGTLDLKTLCKSTFCRIYPTGGYENVLTAIEVFSRYLLAYLLTDASAINVAKVLIAIITNYAYLPTRLITDKGTAFASTTIAEITQILGITLKCATTKHPQTIGKMEQTHASSKTNLKMACGEYRR